MLEQRLNAEAVTVKEDDSPYRRGRYLGQATVSYTRPDGISFLLTYDRYELIGNDKFISIMRHQPNLIPP